MRRCESDRSSIGLKRTAVIMRSATCFALISVTASRGAITRDGREREVKFTTTDGWQIAGSLFIPQSKTKVPAVVLVHGSRHESDAYGQVSTPGLPQTLSEHGVATLRIDIRGRGASREPEEFHKMAPAQRDAVRLDVEAAINFLASHPGIDAHRIGVIAEQDSASAALLAGTKDRRVIAFILISGRVHEAAKQSVALTAASLLCLVSKEDRRGLKDMTDIYLLSNSHHSRLRVFEGLALGTTMFSTWRNEFPQEQPIEEEAGVWLAGRLKSRNTPVNVRRRS